MREALALRLDLVESRVQVKTRVKPQALIRSFIYLVEKKFVFAISHVFVQIKNMFKKNIKNLQLKG